MAPTGAQAESPKKNNSAQDESTAELDTKTLTQTVPQDENEDPALASLKRPAKKKRNPHGKWDGRVAGMTVKEYRERKWGIDACYAKVERRGPCFSMRPSLPPTFAKRAQIADSCRDIFRSFSATLPTAPSSSFGVQFFVAEKETSQGPAEYPIKHTMDPEGHPTLTKSRGARFGSEVLEPRDPPGPAPGQYEVDDAVVHSSAIKKPPNFTIQGREAWRPPTTAPGPGVGEYPGLEGAMKNGKLTPIQWNMQGRTEPLKRPLGQRQHSTPGPPHYDRPGAWPDKVNPNKQCPPNWKFGSESRGLR